MHIKNFKWVGLAVGIASGAWASCFCSFAFEEKTPLLCGIVIAGLFILRSFKARLGLIFIFAFFYGFSTVSLAREYSDYVAWRNPKKMIILEGEVRSFPERSGPQWKWDFKIQAFRMEEGLWYSSKGQVAVSVLATETPPLIGDRLILKGQIRYPDESSPGAKWTQQRFFLRSIQAEIRVKKFGDIIFVGWNQAVLPLRILQLIREWGGKRIEEIYSEKQSMVLRPLLLGLRMQNPELRKIFSETGTSHLLSVSGFHTAVIAGIIFAALILARFSPHQAVTGAALVTLAYMALTGWSVAVQRSGMMMILAWIAWAIGRPQKLIYWLNMALAAILWADPKKLWDISFQLSFLSLYGIILIAPHLQIILKIPGLDISLAAFLATYPVVLFHFQSFSWIGIFANLFAVPVFALILPLGFFSLVPGIGFLPLICTKILLGTVLWLLEKTAALPWASTSLQQPHLELVLAYYFLGGCILWLGPRRSGLHSLPAY